MNAEGYEDCEITPIGITDWRNKSSIFGIRDNDRLGHLYVLGKTGTGKSTLLENMAASDINKNKGIAIIDPHGNLCKNILRSIPKHRVEDVIYFNPADEEYPIGFNPLINIEQKYHNLVVAGLISTFKKIWSDSWGPRLEHILRCSLLTLLEYPEANLLDLQLLLTDINFRTNALQYITDSHLKAFWLNEFEKYSPTFRAEVISPILNKIGSITHSKPLRNTICQNKRAFDTQQIMNERKIFIANLSKGTIGEDATSILGSILISSFQLAALQRSSQDMKMRSLFFMYIDEAHSFLSLAIADILSESRKYGLSLFLTHQYINQLSEQIRESIFGNVGTIISFRIGSNDAEYLEKEFYPIFSKSDFINLPRYSMYLKLMIDGMTSKPFSAKSLPAVSNDNSYEEDIVCTSRRKFASSLIEVERMMKNRFTYLQQSRESTQKRLF